MKPARPHRRRHLLAAAAITALSPIATTRAATPANWPTAVNGNWTDATKWSTNPNYPNNGSPSLGDAYDATIDGTGSAYTVTLGGSIALNNLTLNSATATLQQTGGTLSLANQLNMTAGSYVLQGGTISGGTIAGSPGATIVVPDDINASPTLEGVTLATGFRLGSGAVLSAANNLALQGGTLTLATNQYESRLQLTGGNAQISGTGEIVCSGLATGFYAANNIQLSQAGSTLTVGSGITIRTGTQNGALRASFSSIVNNGLIWASSGKEFSIDTQSLTNHGMIKVESGGMMGMYGAWTNDGSIIVNGGTLNLYGTYSTAGVASITRTGGSIYLSGVQDNTASTFDLQGTVGPVLFAVTGSIHGGTVTNTGSPTYVAKGGTFDGVTLASDLTAGGFGITGGMTISNKTLTVDTSGFASSGLGFSGVQTLGGTGQVILKRGKMTILSGLLTVGANIAIHTADADTTIGDNNLGSLTNYGSITAETLPYTLNINAVHTDNYGTIEAKTGTLLATKELRNQAGGVVTIRPGAQGILEGFWSNSGTIVLEQGTLILAGSFTPASIGTIQRTGGTLYFGGFVDITGSTLALTAATGSLEFNAPGILNHNFVRSMHGGTITTSGGAQVIANAGANFDAVTLGGDMVVSSLITATNGFSLSGGKLTFTSGQLALQGNGTLAGSGEVVFDGGGHISISAGATSLTIAPNVLVRTGTTAGTSYLNNTGGTGTFLNQGTISVQTVGTTLGIYGTNWSNAGQIKVSNGTLELGGTFNIAALGSFTRTGGAVTQTGKLNNAATTLNLNTLGSWTLTGGTITGGTIQGSPTAQLIVSGATVGTLDGVTLAAPMVVQNAQPQILNGLTLAAGGSISLAAGSGTASLDVPGVQTLGGTGEITFAGNSSLNLVRPISGGALTIGSGVTIKTDTRGGTVGSTLGTTNNLGTISSRTAGQTISLVNVTNNNVIETINGGLISFSSGFTNHASISSAGGTQNIGGNWTNDGSISGSAAGTLNLFGTWTNTGTITATDASVNLSGTWNNAGTLTATNSNINFAGTFTLGNIGTFNRTGGSVTISGTLQNTSASLALTASTGSWQLATGGKIIGGTISTSGGAALLASGGTIDSATIQGDVTLQPAAVFSVTNVTNQGTIAMPNGGTLLFTGGTNQNAINATGGSVVLIGAWNNAGTINANNATVQLDGAFSAAKLGTINRTGGSVVVTGAWDNTASTITLDTLSAWNLSGGTITGGTISGGASNAVLAVTSSASSTLNGVTLNANATLGSGATVSTLVLQNGLTLNGTITIGSASSQISTLGTQTISGNGSIVFDANTVSIRQTSGDLTIGPGIMIRSGSRGGGIGTSTRAINNQGTISSQTAGQTITVAGTFTNTGLFEARNGGVATVSSAATLTNFSAGTLTGGTWAAYAGSTVTLPPANSITTNAADITLSGLGSVFSAINSIANNSGSFTIAGGRSFIAPGAFANSGTVNVAATSTFTSTGALNWTGGSIGGDGTVIAASAASITGDVVKPGSGVLRVRGTLTLAPGKKIDLTRGKMILAGDLVGSWNGSAFTGTSALIQSGRNGGAWNGAGIVTSETSATSGNFTSLGIATASQVKGVGISNTAVWSGQTVTGADTLVMYTYGGDATLDGKINVDDYTRIDFNAGLGTAGWYNGDFNYDGKINVDDYTIIDFNVGIQGPPFSAGGGDGGLSAVAVPEPMGVGLAAIAMGAMVRRRRVRGSGWFR